MDTKGLCSGHYQRERSGKPGGKIRIPGNPDDPSTWLIHKDKRGYLVRFCRTGGVNRRIAEHRYVLEVELGRKLLANENVHHINGDRADNRLENLELWNTSQPAGQRAVDKLAWAREIIALYGSLGEQ
jgi:hypothetical protein